MPQCPDCGILWNTAVCPECEVPPGQEPDTVVAARPLAVPFRTALAGLLLNLFFWPGVGSLIVGRPSGWLQGFLVLGAWVMVLTSRWLVAVPLFVFAWLWGLFVGVDALHRAGYAEAASGDGKR